jgi:hypothetical protein
MKKGCATDFTEELIAYEVEKRELHFESWCDFHQWFEENFSLLDKATVVVNHLELIAYFQNKCELDDYINEFDELLRRSGYQDDKLGIVKFRWGLNLKIQDQIACGDELPANLTQGTKPASWCLKNLGDYLKKAQLLGIVYLSNVAEKF